MGLRCSFTDDQAADNRLTYTACREQTNGGSETEKRTDDSKLTKTAVRHNRDHPLTYGSDDKG